MASDNDLSIPTHDAQTELPQVVQTGGEEQSVNFTFRSSISIENTSSTSGESVDGHYCVLQKDIVVSFLIRLSAD